MQNGADRREQSPPVGALDHVAVLVRDTEQALAHFSDHLGLPVLHQERLEEPAVLLTWLDAGAAAVQLVEPLDPDSQLAAVLAERGEGLHHLCFAVTDVREATKELSRDGESSPVVKVRGQLASFVPGSRPHGVLLECTQSDPSASTAP